MQSDPSVLPPDTETIAELRELYRAAEARAARLRLLSVSGRELAEADLATLESVLQNCASRLAFFIGLKGASVSLDVDPSGVPILAPGLIGEAVASIRIDGLESLSAISDDEDREAVRMQLDLMGTTIDRMRKEREKATLLDTLQEREKRLESLVGQIFTAQEEERRRVSHELHDGVAQTATALVRILEGVEATRAKTADASEGVNAAEIARGLVSELRRVIAGLRPTLLDDLGLIPALRSLADGLEEDGYSVTRRLECAGVRLSPLIETALFRVAQEAVSNIRKHAGGPCEVIIEADLCADADERILRVVDQGEGLPDLNCITSPGEGDNVGIEVMRERMSAFGGSLHWNAVPDGGVIVEAKLPKETDLG